MTSGAMVGQAVETKGYGHLKKFVHCRIHFRKG